MLKPTETRLNELEAVVTALANQGEATPRTKTVTVNQGTVWLVSRIAITTASAATANWTRWTDSSGQIPIEATSLILGGQAGKAAGAGANPRLLVRKSSGMIERQIAYLVDAAAAGAGCAIVAEAPCLSQGLEYYVEAGFNALTLYVDGYRI